MIDVDQQAQAQLAQRRKTPSRRTAPLRTRAVEEAMHSRFQGEVYRKYGVSGSTFYFWRCEYVLRRYAESLEHDVTRLRAELDMALAQNAALQRELDAPSPQAPRRQPMRLERFDAERRLEALERQVRLLSPAQAHA